MLEFNSETHIRLPSWSGLSQLRCYFSVDFFNIPAEFYHVITLFSFNDKSVRILKAATMSFLYTMEILQVKRNKIG